MFFSACCTKRRMDMASISTRKNKNGEIISYRIRVSRGYDVKGNKLKPYESPLPI